MPVAADWKPAHVQLHQASAGHLQQACVTREHSETKARFDRVLDGAIGAELHGDLQLDASFSRRLLQRPTAARRRLTHHKRLRGQVLEAEAALPRQPMAGRCDDHELVGDERDDGQVRVLERGTDHGQVELVAQDLLLHASPRPDLQRDDQAGVQLLEGAKSRRQQIDADGRARAYAEVAALDAAHLLERQRRLVEHIERTSRVSVEDRAGLGELDALAQAVEKGQAERLLQLFDLVRNRRLTQSQLLRRLAETAQVGHRFEGTQLTQRHRAVEVERRAVFGHGAYDMRYGRPQTKEHVPVRRTTPTIEAVAAPERAPASVSEQKINQYRKRRYQALHSENEAANKRRAKGLATARERVDMLLDDGSFVELDLFAAHRAQGFGMEERKIAGDGVVAGFGEVDRRPVAVYAYDATVFGGSLGEVTAEKIVKVQELALRNRVPIIGINDSGGARIQEGVVALAGYADIFFRNVRSSGVIPQISVI